MIPELGKSPREGLGYPLQYSWASLVAQLVKNLPTMWETWVQSLGWEDPLEKGKATRSSILAWRIPSDYSLWGHKESDMTDFHFCFIGYTKAFECEVTTNCGKFFKRWKYQTTLHAC